MTLATARWRAVVVLVATLAGTAGTVRLGLWQLDRAAQKTALQQQIEGRRALPPIPADSLGTTPAAAAAQHYRRTTLRGVWRVEYTVFLDNRQMNGVPGFFVVTPFQLENRAEAVLIQRGWVVRHFDDRTALPSLPLPTGSVEIEGSIAPPPSRLYEFSGVASGSIRQNIDLEAFGHESHITLLPLSVQQSATPADAGDGMKRDWPLPAVDVQKHYGYAFQWFALAALMAGLYVWFQLIRSRYRRI